MIQATSTQVGNFLLCLFFPCIYELWNLMFLGNPVMPNSCAALSVFTNQTFVLKDISRNLKSFCWLCLANMVHLLQAKFELQKRPRWPPLQRDHLPECYLELHIEFVGSLDHLSGPLGWRKGNLSVMFWKKVSLVRKSLVNFGYLLDCEYLLWLGLKQLESNLHIETG